MKDSCCALTMHVLHAVKLGVSRVIPVSCALGMQVCCACQNLASSIHDFLFREIGSVHVLTQDSRQHGTSGSTVQYFVFIVHKVQTNNAIGFDVMKEGLIVCCSANTETLFLSGES